MGMVISFQLPFLREVTVPPSQASALVSFARPDLFYLLPLLGCAPTGVDVKALLVHGHACLPFAPLDFGQPGLLLLLPNLQLLYHALVVSLHLLPFLQRHRTRHQSRRRTSGVPTFTHCCGNPLNVILDSEKFPEELPKFTAASWMLNAGSTEYTSQASMLTPVLFWSLWTNYDQVPQHLAHSPPSFKS